MWPCILSVGTMLSQPLFSISMASVCSDVFPFSKLHTTTSTGFSCHYTRKIKWLINLEINSQLTFGIFKYSACKHEKLQHFGNVHRTKTSGQQLRVTWYQTFYVKTYFNTAFLVMHNSQIKCINKCSIWEGHHITMTIQIGGPLTVWYVAPTDPTTGLHSLQQSSQWLKKQNILTMLLFNKLTWSEMCRVKVKVKESLTDPAWPRGFQEI
jgi:hypothetical protein